MLMLIVFRTMDYIFQREKSLTKVIIQGVFHYFYGMKRIGSLVVLPVIAALSFISCGGHGIAARLRTAESIVNEHPDSALKIIMAIDASAINRSCHKAKYWLLYAMTLDKNYIDTTDLSIIEPAVKYYMGQNEPENLALALYYQGRIQQNREDYTASTISFTMAEQYVDALDNPTIPFLLYMAIANDYAKTYNSTEEVAYALKGLTVAKDNHLEQYIPTSEYRYALSLANHKQYDKAIAIIDSLSSSAGSPSGLKKICCVKGTYYRTLWHLLPPEELLTRFDEAILSGCRLDVYDKCAYAYVLGRCGKMAAAKELFEQVKATDVNGEQIVMSWESDLAAAIGKYDIAYKLQDQALVVQDSVVRFTLQQSLSKMQKNYYKVRMAEEERGRKLEKQALVIVVLSFLLVLIGLVFVIYLGWRRHKIREEDIKARMDRLSSTMRAIEVENESRLDALRRRYLTRMFRPLGTLYSNYQFGLQHGDDVSFCQKQLLKALDDINIEKDNGWFEEVLNKETEDLPERFKSDFPTIKQEDYRLFCYYLAGFDATTISIITKAPSQNAIYVRKNRLRKTISDSSVPDKERYLSVLS